jgi:hypothetical protein
MGNGHVEVTLTYRQVALLACTCFIFGERGGGGCYSSYVGLLDHEYLGDGERLMRIHHLLEAVRDEEAGA